MREETSDFHLEPPPRPARQFVFKLEVVDGREVALEEHPLFDELIPGERGTAGYFLVGDVFVELVDARDRVAVADAVPVERRDALLGAFAFR
jgi:hypothetical protein